MNETKLEIIERPTGGLWVVEESGFIRAYIPLSAIPALRKHLNEGMVKDYEPGWVHENDLHYSNPTCVVRSWGKFVEVLIPAKETGE